jgi:hypothetical protein
LYAVGPYRKEILAIVDWKGQKKITSLPQVSWTGELWEDFVPMKGR